MRTAYLVAALAIACMGGATVAQAQQRQVQPPIEGQGCPSPGSQSPRTNQKIKMTFTNSQQNRLGVYWVNFQGNFVLYADLQRGKSYNVTSYLGHIWVLLNDKGRCISTMSVPRSGGDFNF